MKEQPYQRQDSRQRGADATHRQKDTPQIDWDAIIARHKAWGAEMYGTEET